MRALAVWPGGRRTGIVDHPEPELQSPTSVRVRILEVGVCGTDAEICAFHFGTAPAGSDYLILGHEALGEVDEVGPEVSHLRPGDLVVPSVRRPCPRADCPACRSGNQDFCLTGEFTERGITGAHGFLTERIVEDEAFLYALPTALREVGVLTEPLTIAEKALRQFLAAQRRLPWTRAMEDRDLLSGTCAVVLGAGPVGILGSMLLVERGCRVWLYSREPRGSAQASLVESVGARYASSSEISFAELAAEIGPVGLVYEAAGSAAFTLEVLRHLGPNAALVTTGAQGPGAPIQIPGDELLTRVVVNNQMLLGTVNAHASDFESAIRDLERFAIAWPDALGRIITGRHAMADFCPCALQREGIKRVIAM